jgi:hypothetical protein
MARYPSPYLKPGFYDEALSKGRHRDIVGGRWDETGRVQMALLQGAGLEPRHQLLDIGAGSLRLGCKAVPYLEPGHYWGTDASRALMLAGYEAELSEKERLDPEQLIEDAAFAFEGVGAGITHAMAFGVFPHLPEVSGPEGALALALAGLARFEALEMFLFTVFLAPDAAFAAGLRQVDGVVTHPDRAPYHLRETEVRAVLERAGWWAEMDARWLPRGQVLFRAGPQKV